jgi:hypothetical protein
MLNRIDPSVRLRRAILLNDVLLVQRIVKNHPKLVSNPDFEDKSNTSLHLVASHGFTEIAERLIEAGHDHYEISRNADHDTPLMLAARNGHVDATILLMKCFPRSIPYTNKAGMDALSMAARTVNGAVLVPALLNDPQFPASPHGKDQDGNTALHHASAAGSLKALRVLVMAGADPHAKNNYDWTPLAYSQTVAAEVYFKTLMAELERLRQDDVKQSEERERAKSAGLRIVAAEDQVTPVAELDNDEVLKDALARHWSPVEKKRPNTPGGGTSARYEWGAALTNMRTRSGSGE